MPHQYVLIAALLTCYPIVMSLTRDIIAINAGGGSELDVSTGTVFEQDRCVR